MKCPKDADDWGTRFTRCKSKIFTGKNDKKVLVCTRNKGHKGLHHHHRFDRNVSNVSTKSSYFNLSIHCVRKWNEEEATIWAL